MECLYCGEELGDEMAFCPTCGSPVIDDDLGYYEEITLNPRGSFGKKLLVGALVGVGIAAVGVTAAFFATREIKRRNIQLKANAIDIARRLLDRAEQA